MNAETGKFQSMTHANGTVPLNGLEMSSIRSLIAYAAHNKGIEQSTVQEMLNMEFGIQDVAQLPSQSFDDVIKFLVDLNTKMLLN